MTSIQIDLLTDTVARLLRDQDAIGATIAVSVDGDVSSAGVGFRDLERSEPIAVDARFYLYSVTKTILATAILRLCEQRKVDLDQPISEVLPDVSFPLQGTVRQTLNHTAGLPDYGGLPSYNADLKADPTTPWTIEQFLANTFAGGCRFPPGTDWAYSNIGYLLIKHIVETVTGQSLREALRTLVFQPAGVERMVVAESLADAQQLTPGFSIGLDADGQLHDISRRYHPGWVSHGVVIADAAETARLFDAIFAGESLLATEWRAAMLQSVRVAADFPPFAAPAYGLGVMTDRASRFGQVAGHAGGGPGYATAAFHFYDVAGHRVTAVALINHDRANAAVPIVFALVDLIEQRLTGQKAS